MSQENVELVRRLYRTVNRGGVQAVVGFMHPDVEVVPPSDWPDASTIRGREQVQEIARQWMESFEDFKVEPERFVDPGGNRVVVFVRDRGRIKSSDTEIDTRLVHVWTLAAGKIMSWEVFMDEAHALEAVGLGGVGRFTRLTAMSQENVDLVRGMFDAFGRRDIAAALEAYSPQIEWTTASDEPDSRTLRGLEGLRTMVDGWLQTWEENLFSAAEPQEFIGAGDHVVVPVRALVRGKASGVPVKILETYDFRIEDGKVVEVREYRTKEQALEALGLAD
jgi:uncharacterized protein